MAVRKLSAVISCVVAAALAAATGQGVSNDQSRALALLVRAFDRISPRNIVAIMRMPLQGAGQFQTVEVQIATDGRQKLTVLQPIQQAGIVILDLGTTRQIYDPDKQTLTIGASPAADLIAADERVRLVKQNYVLRLIRNVPIAGHSTTRIDATSRYPGFGGVTIYIDPQSYFVFRVDCFSASGVRTKRFDTETVNYPPTLSASTFVLPNVTVTTSREANPVPVKNLAVARRQIGFTPLPPRDLPFGFVVRKAYVRVAPSYKSIGFNLSDGLTAGTVFEFSAQAIPPSLQAEMKARPNDFFQSGDVVVGIVSDLDPKIRAKILKAFRSRKRTSFRQAENLFNRLKIDRFGTATDPSDVATLGSGWRTQTPLGKFLTTQCKRT